MFLRSFKKERWNFQTRPGPKNSPELFSSIRKRIKYFLIFKHLTGLTTLDCGRRGGNTNPAAQQCCREISRRVLESQERNDIPSHRPRRTVSEKRGIVLPDVGPGVGWVVRSGPGTERFRGSEESALRSCGMDRFRLQSEDIRRL